MVGMLATSSEKVARLINSAKFAINIPSKLECLRQLKEELSDADPALLSEFIPSILELHTDSCSPARKFVTEIVGNVGLKYSEFLPEIIPVLVTVLKDCTPAVARQSIACGIDIFRCTLVKIAIQGLYSSELDDTLESSWEWVLKFRDEIYPLAFQPGSDGRRLLALKFIESVILLYTPDPTGSSEPPKNQNYEGTLMEFNMSWLRGGHPVLNVGDLSKEASQSLGLLLDQLRLPTVASVSNLMIIVLINSLSTIAKKRPAFYGRILPVLLGLDTSSSASKGVHASGAHLALKNAFLSCLKCTHTGAAPWRNRLIGALDEMKAGDPVEEDLHQVLPRTNGGAEWKDDSSFTQEEKPSIKACADVQVSSGKKRSVTHDINDPSDDDNVLGKRARTTPNNIKQEPKSTKDQQKDNGPVQQLVAMFGALVAQGEKAAGSLDILVSSISSDLLAEVVMANIWNLPLIRPKLEEDELRFTTRGAVPSLAASDADFRRLSSYLGDVLSMSGTFSQADDIMDAQPSVSHDLQKAEEEEEQPMVTSADTNLASSDIHYTIQQTPVPIVPISSQEDIPSQIDIYPNIKSEIGDIEDIQNEIPGLDSTISSDILPEPVIASSFDPPPESDELDQEQVTNLSRSSLEIVPSMSTDERSEELSPKAGSTDATSVSTSSVGFSSQLVLPKMSAAVITLADEQRDNIQKSAFVRIIEAYKQIIVAGGSQVRSAVLACLAVEFPLELDPWKLLQTHILSDYVNLEGHDLTLRVLYRLYSEAEADRDFFSSTTATSVYEMFLLTVAETLRDSFPASDKSLSRLLGEVPYLPKSIFKLLECLCSPGNADNNNFNKDGKDNGDRVTQGLSIVWSLILLRPPIRDVCLNIALQSAVHHLEEVRMKAIRLVANKLYPLSSISQQIEDFAKEMLFCITKVDCQTDVDRSNAESEHKDSGMENTSSNTITKDTSADGVQLSASENVASSSTTEVQRCMSLYFALCTKKHSLFRQVFVIYESASQVAKQAVHRQIPILVRTIGSSSQLLEIILDPPKGSETLLIQVLQTLTEGTIPSPELIFTIRKLYDTKVKDPEVLIPVLSFLQKDEVLAIFPRLVNLPPEKFQAALSHVLRGSSQSGPVLTPAEVLIAIHGIDPDSSGIPLKKVTDACNACFEQRQIFTQQVLAKVLNQLVEQIPLPLLFMRTVLQAIGAFPSLVEFIMEILARLVSKQIWKYPKLWVGFLKCAQLTKPQSFSVLLQLPPAQLENALNRTGALKAPLIAHANQPHVRASLPRSVLVVLGLATDPQNASQSQPTLVQTSTETTNSDKESLTEKSKESSSAAS